MNAVHSPVQRKQDGVEIIEFQHFQRGLLAVCRKADKAGDSPGLQIPENFHSAAGTESTVHILDKVTRNKAKMSWSGGYEDITFAGTRMRGNTRTRNAEIAFINEYGSRTQDARPFIGKAMTQYEEQIAAPGEKIVGDWIEKEFEK